MTNSAVRNLDMFQRLCGEKSLKNVILLTTKWDKPADFAERHEKELTYKFWAPMIKLGCSDPKRLGIIADPLSRIVDPIRDIIAPVLRFKPTWLQIQRELGKGKDLHETAAGMYIDHDLSVAMVQYKQGFESTLAAFERSYEQQVKAALAEQAEAFQRNLNEAKDDKKALREDFEKVMEAQVERRSLLFGYDLLDRLQDYVTELRHKDSKFRLSTVGTASIGLFEACNYVWKKQGRSQDLIDSAEKALPSLS